MSKGFCAHAPRLLLLTTLACLLAPVTAAAQPTRRIARRTDFDDLSRFLMESEGSNLRRPVGSIFDGNPNFDARGVNMTEVRQLVRDFAEDASRLYRSLETDYDRTPALRPYLSQAVKLRARSAMLEQDASGSRDVRELAAFFQEIDRDWRLLAHNLTQVGGLSRGTTQLITRLNRSDEALGNAFNMDPQLNRREVVTQVMALSADFENLIDDLQLEMGNTQQTAALVRQTRIARQQAIIVGDAVSDRERYDQVVADFQTFSKAWKPLSRELTKIDNRYIERSVRRIARTNQNLHHLLWLPETTDRTELIQVNNGLLASVDEFFRRTPLLLLLRLDDTDYAISISNEFYGVVQNFADCVEREESDAELMDCYRYVEESAADFVRTFRGMPSQAGQSVLRDIQDDVSRLREIVHYSGDTYDPRQGIDLASQLETLAAHLDYDMKHWLQQSRVPFRDEALRQSSRFATDARNLHDSLLNGASQQQLRQEMEQLYAGWRRIHGYLRQAPAEERQHLATLASHITDSLYDLKIPLDL